MSIDEEKSGTARDYSFLEPLEGGIRRPRPGVVYTCGLLLVAFTMVLLPLIYLALIGLGGWAVYYHTVHHFQPIMSWGTLNWRVMVLKFFIYAAPIVVGVIVVFFLLKPLLSRRAKPPQSLALNPAAEPVLFAFIAAVCRAVGAPMPRRVDLDCQLNAAAGFRRGFLSFLGSDLVLVIGLPLAGNLTVAELAGVLAHEFGHFGQGLGMRLSYLIGSINRWFARVVFERDGWDIWLAEATEQADEWWEVVLFAIAQAGVGLSRLILHGLMLVGHGISSFMSRQMEYDADLYEIRLAGSDVFEKTTQKLATLGAALEKTYKELRVQWNTSRHLPDSLPATLRLTHEQLPGSMVSKIHGELGLRRSGAFATHPSPAERIRQARREVEAGIFHDDRPATVLFERFAIPARQVTILHYSEDIGLPVLPEMLTPTESDESSAKVANQSADAGAPDLYFGLGDLLLPIELSPPVPSEDAAATLQEIELLDSQLAALEPQLRSLAGEYLAARAGWAKAAAAERIQAAVISPARLDSRKVAGFQEVIDSLRHSLHEIAAAYTRRLNLSVTLLAAVGPDAASHVEDAARLVADYRRCRAAADELQVAEELKRLLQGVENSSASKVLSRQFGQIEALLSGRDSDASEPKSVSTLRLQAGGGAKDADNQNMARLRETVRRGLGAYVGALAGIWLAAKSESQ